MTREKKHDEIYCRSCGEPIKKKAEICPECGVQNEYSNAASSSSRRAASGAPSTGSQTTQASRQGATRQAASSQQTTAGGTSGQSPPSSHDPTQYTTTASDNWHYGVAAAVGLWVLGFLIPEGVGLDPFAGLLFLTAWVLMPLSVYYDCQYLRATTNWDPEQALWLIGAAFPLVNIAVGAVYLLRRNNVSKVAPASAGVDVPTDSDDEALDTLRERYSRGEIGDAEFERRLEQIVGTEDRETAEVHARDVAESKSE